MDSRNGELLAPLQQMLASCLGAFITSITSPTSLWSGLPPTLVMAVPATMVYFTCYEQIKLALTTRSAAPDTPPFWIPFVAGTLARTWAVTLVSPLEMIRTKMQSRRIKYIGIYWMSYESLFPLLCNHLQDLWCNFAAGAISGSIAASLTLPFDVIKTHRQIQLGEQELSPGVTWYRCSDEMLLLAEQPQSAQPFRNICLNIYREHGLRGFYMGLAPRLFKVAPACAIMITSYEFMKRKLVKQQKEHR